MKETKTKGEVGRLGEMGLARPSQSHSNEVPHPGLGGVVWGPIEAVPGPFKLPGAWTTSCSAADGARAMAFRLDDL